MVNILEISQFLMNSDKISSNSNRIVDRILSRKVRMVRSLGDSFTFQTRLAVVGAGWGGAYIAWRMAVDTKALNATDVCVFEANGRVGGRIYSVRGLPGFADA